MFLRVEGWENCFVVRMLLNTLQSRATITPVECQQKRLHTTYILEELGEMQTSDADHLLQGECHPLWRPVPALLEWHLFMSRLKLALALLRDRVGTTFLKQAAFSHLIFSFLGYLSSSPLLSLMFVPAQNASGITCPLHPVLWPTCTCSINMLLLVAGELMPIWVSKSFSW